MAAELRDLRAKVTAEAYCALEAEAQVSGRDRSEIVREILHQWALEQMRKASVLDRLLQAEGMSGQHSGIAGNRREPEGGSR